MHNEATWIEEEEGGEEAADQDEALDDSWIGLHFEELGRWICCYREGQQAEREAKGKAFLLVSGRLPFCFAHRPFASSYRQKHHQ